MFSSYQKPSSVSQLYVGDLDPSTREVDLLNHFRPYGEISAIKIIKSQLPGRRSSAFVSFKDSLIPPNLRRDLNGSKIGNSVIRVCKITKDFDPQANIFIKNIPKAVSLKALDDKFSTFGSIISSKLALSQSGQSLGYGFIQFDFAYQAKAAIKAMNGQQWEECVLSVSEYLPVSSRHFSNNANLYIKNFPVSYTQETIKDIFAEFGEIVSIGVISANHLGKVQAYGFVCFKNVESAGKACEVMHQKKETDFEWYVAPHMNRVVRKAYLREEYLKKVQEWKLKNLYIRNLHTNICESKLKDICIEYGSITSVKIVKNEHIKYNADGEMTRELHSKGIGFVCFELESAAIRAFKGLQEKSVEGVKLFVARWLPISELKYRIFEKALKRKIQQGEVKTAGVRSDPRVSQRILNMPIPIKNLQVLPAPISFIPGPSRQTIGEKLYQIVLKFSNPLVAGKITGMLLEIDLSVLEKLMNNETVIKQKVLEAIEVLRKAWKDEPEKQKILPLIKL